MKGIRKLTNFNISGFSQKVKRVKSLSKQFYLVKSFSDKDSWGYINWKYRIVRGLRDFLGHYPDILKHRGVLKVIPLGEVLTRTLCNNSPKRTKTTKTPLKIKQKKKKQDSEIKQLIKQNIKQIDDTVRFESARARVEYSKKCGSRGGVYLLTKEDMSVHVCYHPIRCHSVFCPVCSKEWGDKVRSRIVYALENASAVDFVTLTLKNSECSNYEDVRRAVDEAFQALTKLYNFKISNRFLSRLETAFNQEKQAYYENILNKYQDKKKALEAVNKQSVFFSRFLSSLQSFIGRKLGQVISAVWRLEVKSHVEGDKLVVHPHWHGLVAIHDVEIPKLAWTVLWRMASEGSHITDVRRVPAGAVGRYVSKYESKPEELPSVTSRGFALSVYEARVWIEYALYGRQRLRVWGFSLLKQKKEKKENVVFVPHLRVTLDVGIPNYLGAFLLLKARSMEGKEDEDRVFLANGTVRDDRSKKEYPVEVFFQRGVGFVIDGIPEDVLSIAPRSPRELLRDMGLDVVTIRPCEV